MTATFRFALACVALAGFGVHGAAAQTAFKLEGTCESLVVAGRSCTFPRRRHSSA